jgi:hypothetical protein
MARQLSQCQAEASEARHALKVAEEVLGVEVRQRKEAERVAEEEARMRKMLEDELRTLQ